MKDYTEQIGHRATDDLYPPDARCDFEHEGRKCGHKYKNHVRGANSDACIKCDRTVEYDAFVFHFFVPRKLCGGAYTPTEERAAYDCAMRGE